MAGSEVSKISKIVMNKIPITMRQPQLGQKILEMRKAKGFTQEELVEKCNLNVRTLQRIEAGEVSPRPFTIRAIFEVLDVDYSAEQEHDSKPGGDQSYQENKVPPNGENPRLRQLLTTSLVAGGIYFLLAFIEAWMDFQWLVDNDLRPDQPWIYVIIKIFVLVSLFLFIRGYYLLAKKWANEWTSTASIIYIIVVALTVMADLWLFLQPDLPLELVMGSKSVVYGLGLFLFSLSLLTFQKELGPLALVAAAFGILNGILFLTVILALPGLFLLAPVELLQIVLLFTARRLFQKAPKEGQQNATMHHLV
jgi:transcriptional regulator with XRE-family HTH domain